MLLIQLTRENVQAPVCPEFFAQCILPCKYWFQRIKLATTHLLRVMYNRKEYAVKMTTFTMLAIAEYIKF